MTGERSQTTKRASEGVAPAVPSGLFRMPHVRRTFTRYRDASRSLRVPASRRSRHGLDWLNFFVADMQTGYGSFVAFYLGGMGWSQGAIGLALSTDNFLAVLGQIPGGALADSTARKRSLAAFAILAIAAASLALALASHPAIIYGAQAIHGLTAGVLTAAIASISLGLVGRGEVSYRVGRNYRFSATGNALTAAGMGMVGSYFGAPMIFVLAAALAIPALIALVAIRPEEIDYARARNAGAGDAANQFQRVWELRKNKLLFIFAGALALFQLADAAMLPAVSAHLGQNRGNNGILTSTMMLGVLVIIPQIVVAVLAPWIGYHSEHVGRKPLLLIGLAAQVLRALVLALSDHYSALVSAQVLDGVSGAVIGVLTLLVIVDITAGSGRFNLARGLVATTSGIAAAVSTVAAGALIEWLGYASAFVAMAAAAVASCIVVLTLLPETKPAKYAEDGSAQQASDVQEPLSRAAQDMPGPRADNATA